MGSLRDINPAEYTSLAEFDDAIDYVNEECTSIEQQLLEAKGAACQYGEYADAEWYAKASSAARIAKALKQKLARKRAELSAKLRSDAHIALEEKRERRFIKACREILSTEQYNAIWQRADGISDSEIA